MKQENILEDQNSYLCRAVSYNVWFSFTVSSTRNYNAPCLLMLRSASGAPSSNGESASCSWSQGWGGCDAGAFRPILSTRSGWGFPSPGRPAAALLSTPANSAQPAGVQPAWHWTAALVSKCNQLKILAMSTTIMCHIYFIWVHKLTPNQFTYQNTYPLQESCEID